MTDRFAELIPADELKLDSALINSKLEKLSEIFVIDHNRPQFVIMSLNEYEKHSHPQPQSPHTSAPVPKVKIGLYVQDSMRHLVNDHILPDDEINRLTDAEYCSQTFGISYPVLKLYDPTKSFDEQKRDNNNYNRYYNFRLYNGSCSYLLCSQWVEATHRARFEAWLENWQ